MRNFRIVIDFETDDNVTLGMLTRDLENNTITGDGVTAYKIVEARETTLKRATKEVLDMKIDEPHFSIRAMNCLDIAGIRTVRELVRHRKSDLAARGGVGKKTLDEVDRFFDDHGLHWGMDV